MADFKDVRAAAFRIRAAVESLTNSDDVAIVRDYLTELELLAARQEAEDARRTVGALHLSICPEPSQSRAVESNHTSI